MADERVLIRNDRRTPNPSDSPVRPGAVEPFLTATLGDLVLPIAVDPDDAHTLDALRHLGDTVPMEPGWDRDVDYFHWSAASGVLLDHDSQVAAAVENPAHSNLRDPYLVTVGQDDSRAVAFIVPIDADELRAMDDAQVRKAARRVGLQFDADAFPHLLALREAIIAEHAAR